MTLTAERIAWTQARRIDAAEKEPRIPADFAGKKAKARSPLSEAVRRWDRAISATDAHSRKCRPCNLRRIDERTARLTGVLATMDPYKPCREAERLHAEEIAARKGYMEAGGILPVKR